MTAPAESGLADVLRDRNDLSGARSKHETALKYFTHIGDTYGADSEELAMARLNLDERHYEDAVKAAHKAADDLHATKHYDDEALALSLLAETSAALRHPNEARLAAGRADALVSKGQARLVRLEVRMSDEVTASVLEPAGKGSSSTEVRRLRVIASDARVRGIVRMELEARLAQAVLSGPAATRALAEVQKEASRKGFLLIASRAQAANAQR
jgi:tetratricopeptide (TPR) repeat protein